MIIFATFPRCGHHFIIKILGEIDDKLSYCEKYKCENHLNEPIMCGGKKLPVFFRQICRANKYIQKTHDFHLNEPILRGKLDNKPVKYFSLIRHPLPAIISRWKLAEQDLLTNDSKNLDKRALWENFFKTQLKYYDGFIKKYISKASHVTIEDENHAKFASYEEITTNFTILKKTINFFLRSDKKNITNTDEEKIKKLINVNKNKVKNFKFYEKNFINKEMNNYNFSKIEKYIKI